MRYQPITMPPPPSSISVGFPESFAKEHNTMTCLGLKCKPPDQSHECTNCKATTSDLLCKSVILALYFNLSCVSVTSHYIFLIFCCLDE